MSFNTEKIIVKNEDTGHPRQRAMSLYRLFLSERKEMGSGD